MKIKITSNHRLGEYFPKSIKTKAKSYQGLSCLDRTNKQTNRQTNIENYNIDTHSQKKLILNKNIYKK